ncbi:conserved hypothetical protein [Desulforapulum autotrophicum HRM2]|uniref:Uncharacterized protein n=1 Tax=Desulforapulum autotrophicum (strain ATCC 43914 / DSM 3382 / VKM B-1955 / HRM2) TaxID=177437 RepID=C0QA47_DESAH|nr:hypothetical protein [Desulforapulum autotrophicum]ACN16765.1 conserved hypothetical protein [Desulforapulum autotrophicum HRM2]
MTTIPGHNVVVQQSGVLHEATHHVRPNNPDPEQLAAQQAAKEIVERSTVPESNSSPEVASDREKKKKDKGSADKARAKRQTKGEQPPDMTGNLLDTIA